MEQGHETPKFVSSRVAERINENPNLATFVLHHLVRVPEPSKDDSRIYAEEYGPDFSHMHTFLSGVISDMNTYLAIDVPDEAVHAAENDPAQQERMKRIQ